MGAFNEQLIVSIYEKNPKGRRRFPKIFAEKKMDPCVLDFESFWVIFVLTTEHETPENTLFLPIDGLNETSKNNGIL